MVRRRLLLPFVVCILLLCGTACTGETTPVPSVSEEMTLGALDVTLRRDEVVERNRVSYLTVQLVENGAPVRGGEVLVQPFHAVQGAGFQRIALEGPNGYYGVGLSFGYTGTYTVALAIRTQTQSYAFDYGPIEVQPRVRRGMFDYR
jgi:hypothetical protein